MITFPEQDYEGSNYFFLYLTFFHQETHLLPKLFHEQYFQWMQRTFYSHDCETSLQTFHLAINISEQLTMTSRCRQVDLNGKQSISISVTYLIHTKVIQ